MKWDVFIADLSSRGPRPEQVSRQLSDSVDANTEEAAEVEAWKLWDAEYDTRPPSGYLHMEINPAARRSE